MTCLPENTSSTSMLLAEIRQIKDILLKSQERLQSEEERKTYLREWRMVACVTDRLFFVVYVTINAITIIVLFTGT